MSNLTESADWQDYDGPLYRDCNTTEYADPPDTPGCQLYNFIMYAVFGGSICVLGCVGNVLAFIVFWCDKVKTSTSLLFQVGIVFSLTVHSLHFCRDRYRTASCTSCRIHKQN